MRVLLTIFTSLIMILSAQDFEYVGSSNCKMCHNKPAKGEQFKIWSERSHAGAFETLKSENAAKIFAEKGFEGNAWESAECLGCHVTGYGIGGYEVKDEAFWNPAVEDKNGKKAVKRMAGLQAVGCEACHGAGSGYKSNKTMKAITAGEIEAKSVGLLCTSEETCKTCHNEKSPTFKGFDYEMASEKVAHPYPEGMGQ